MSDQTTSRTSPSHEPHRRPRRAAVGALLGALVITGPWTVPAAGYDTGPDAGPREAFTGVHGPPAPAEDSLDPYSRPFHGLFEAYDFLDDEHLYQALYTSSLTGATRTSPVSAYPISAAYGIPGSWAAGHHTGVDFAAPTGTTVRSVGPGRVVQAEYSGDYGNVVMVKMTDGYYALYAHLSKISVKVDEQVKTGAKLGESGSTGRSTGPHLHFELRTGPGYGSDVDPLAYLASHGVRSVV